MNLDWVTQIINILGSGAVIGIATLIINQRNKKYEIRTKSIDDRIYAWQKIADEHKSRFEQMDVRVTVCERYTADLQRHITSLEQLILKADPSVALPERPIQNGS